MRLSFLVISLLLSFGLGAQNSVSVTGVVTDRDNNMLEWAVIQFFNLTDSAGITGGITNSIGQFKINIPAGNYIVKVSFIGYADVIQNIAATKTLNLMDTVKLSEANIELDSTLIIGKLPEMVVNGDTIEYNAVAFKVLPSAVVEDLIKKLPGAEIDEEGNIKINGKEVKRILVDKKEFFSTDPKVASRNLPAEMVEKVQVWDKRSDMAELTGFDDGEEETVLNLTVKPGMKKGLFGNLSAGYGSKERYDANVSMNYIRNNTQYSLIGGGNNVNNERFSDRASSTFSGSGPSRGVSFGGRNGIRKSFSGGFNFATELSPKFKFGGNISSGNTDNDVIRSSFNQNYIKSGDQYETRNSTGNNVGKNLNSDLRLEWNPSKNTRIIFTPNVRYSGNTNRQSSTYLTTLENPADSINWGHSSYLSDNSGLNLNGNLNFSHKFVKKGRTLSFSIFGGLNEQKTEGFNNSRTDYKTKKSVVTDQIFNTNNDSYNWRGFVSFVEPLGKNNFIQLSYSYRSRYSEQDKITYKNDGFGNYDIVDSSATKKLENDFVNQEIKANFQSVREKYNYTVGLALQPSNSESRTFEPDTAYAVKNNVLNFAPVVQFVYRWDKQTNLRINYNGTVNQPNTTQLSSARDESNPLNIRYGNPNLKPAFENRFRLQFQKTNREQGSTITLSSNFSFTTNDIVRYSLVDSVGKRESTYKNINGNKNADIRFSINRQFKNRKFSVNATSNARYSADNSFVNGVQNTSDNLTLSQNLGGSYRSDLFDLSLRGNLRYNGTKNTLPTQVNRDVYNYGGSANTTVYLPWNFSIESELNYSANAGYSSGFDQNEWIWNATVQKQLFAKKNATIRFRMLDILKQRSNISRSSSAQSMQYSTTNTLGSYFIVHFVYRLQVFGKNERGSFRRGSGSGGRGERSGGERSGGERNERNERSNERIDREED